MGNVQPQQPKQDQLGKLANIALEGRNTADMMKMLGSLSLTNAEAAKLEKNPAFLEMIMIDARNAQKISELNNNPSRLMESKIEINTGIAWIKQNIKANSPHLDFVTQTELNMNSKAPNSLAAFIDEAVTHLEQLQQKIRDLAKTQVTAFKSMLEKYLSDPNPTNTNAMLAALAQAEREQKKLLDEFKAAQITEQARQRECNKILLEIDQKLTIAQIPKPSAGYEPSTPTATK